MTVNLVPLELELITIVTDDLRRQAISNLLTQLPVPNFHTLKILLQLLAKISDHSLENEMPSNRYLYEKKSHHTAWLWSPRILLLALEIRLLSASNSWLIISNTCLRVQPMNLVRGNYEKEWTTNQWSNAIALQWQRPQLRNPYQQRSQTAKMFKTRKILLTNHHNQDIKGTI